MMEKRRIGNSDIEVSVVGLGCNNFGGRLDAAGSKRVIEHALDRGIDFFDTSDTYGEDSGSEKLIGEVLGARRDRVVIATKFGSPLDGSGLREGASRRYVFEAVEASLRRLRTDRIDLYQLHKPDPETPIAETLEALAELQRQGKIRAAGCSNFSAAQLAEARRAADAAGLPGFVSSQDQYSLLARGVEEEILPELRRQGMSFIPYAPLASGFLTGKYRKDAPLPAGTRLSLAPKQADRYLSEGNWRLVEGLGAFAERRGRTLLEVAVAWVASRDLVCSVIAGAMSAEQIDANVAAAAWTLTADEIAEIESIDGD